MNSNDSEPVTSNSGLLKILGLASNGDTVASESEELRHVQAGIRALIDSLPMSLLIKDRAGRRVLVNKHYLELHQRSAEELLGKTDFDLFPEEFARVLVEDDAKVLNEGIVLHGHEQHRTGDGTIRWIDRIKGPVRDADGKIVGVQVLFWDVSDRKEADEALERERYLLHSLLDNIPDAIYFKDRMSRFVRISRSMSEKFGLKSPDAAIGKTDADIFTEEHASQARADELTVMRSGEPIVAQVEKETWHDRIDTWCSTTKMPLRDGSGNIVGTFGISRDVSELKRVQDSLKEARDAADHANRAKSDFLANMSHEIRTPMNAIIGMTELLMDSQLSPTQHEYLTMVQQSGESLLALLNDILDFSKIEAGKLELDPTPFDVRESLGDTMRSLSLRAHSKGLELAFAIHSEVPFVLVGDIHRLRQIIVNLVGNAIKFTEQGEVVLDVSCHSIENGRAELLFAVKDTGIGIPADKLDAVFEEFQQADSSTTRNYGGTGLGLAISSRLVELMGGNIEVDSVYGQGSTFSFSVALQVADEQSARRRRAPVNLSDTQVLIVDDNATNRRILHDMMLNWGANPTLTSSAREAFDRLQSAHSQGEPFGLLLSDVNMPEHDGFQLAEWIREREEFADLPIIMLTSSGRPGDVGRRNQLRINAHQLKPVKQSELFDSIMDVLGVADVGQSIQEASAGQTAAETFRTYHVLLAEDNKVNQTLAKGVLKQLGHTFEIAENGRQAVEAWSRGGFELILMDVQMPEMDGLAAVQAIRQRERETGTHIPVIAMTAHAMKGDRERCIDAGMDEYLSKPVRKQDLANMIAVMMQQGSRVTASVENSGTQDVIHWKDALEVAGGDRELLIDVIEAFLEEAETLMRRISADIRNHDADALRRDAHTLKGGLLGVGAKPVSVLAFELEKLGMAGVTTGADSRFVDLQSQMEVLVPLLKQGPPEI